MAFWRGLERLRACTRASGGHFLLRRRKRPKKSAARDRSEAARKVRGTAQWVHLGMKHTVSERGRAIGRTTEKVSEFLPVVWRYYRSNPAGGPLHLVLDDGNSDGLAICLEAAIRDGDVAGESICRTLMTWTVRERDALFARYEDYCFGAPEPSREP